MSFVPSSNGFLMFYRTPSNCSCWEKPQLLSLTLVTLQAALRKTTSHTTSSLRFFKESSAIIWCKFTIEKYFPPQSVRLSFSIFLLLNPSNSGSLVFIVNGQSFSFLETIGKQPKSRCNLFDKLEQRKRKKKKLKKIEWKFKSPRIHRKDQAYLRFHPAFLLGRPENSRDRFMV